MSEKMLEQLKLSFALLIRAAVQELMHRRFVIDVPIWTVGESQLLGFHPAEAVADGVPDFFAVRVWKIERNSQTEVVQSVT